MEHLPDRSDPLMASILKACSCLILFCVWSCAGQDQAPTDAGEPGERDGTPIGGPVDGDGGASLDFGIEAGNPMPIFELESAVVQREKTMLQCHVKLR